MLGVMYILKTEALNMLDSRPDDSSVSKQPKPPPGPPPPPPPGLPQEHLLNTNF